MLSSKLQRRPMLACLFLNLVAPGVLMLSLPAAWCLGYLIGMPVTVFAGILYAISCPFALTAAIRRKDGISIVATAFPIYSMFVGLVLTRGEISPMLVAYLVPGAGATLLLAFWVVPTVWQELQTKVEPQLLGCGRKHPRTLA